MKKVFFVFFSLVLFSSSLFFGIRKVSAADPRTVKVTTLNPDKDDIRDFYLVYGEQVEVTGEVNGDVYAFGGQVYIDATINGDVLTAGGTVTFSGEATQDVRIAAGQATIAGTVGRNLTVAAGDLEIVETARVYGGLAAASGNILIDAPIEGEVKLAAGTVNFANTVGSDVEVWSNSVRLSPNALIDGNLTFYSESDLSLSNDSSVSGDITRGRRVVTTFEEADFQSFKQGMKKFQIFGRVVKFIAALIVGITLLKLFPNCTLDTVDLISKKTGKVILTGLLTLIVTPIVAVLLLFTVVASPISMLIIFIYFFLFYLSKIYFSFWLGRLIGKNFLKNNYLELAFGLIIFYLLKFIVVINFFVSLTSLILGLGAAVVGGKKLYKAIQKAKLA